MMQCKWLGEQVATPLLKLALHKQEAGNWGPNATLKFSEHGGTGAIWKAVSQYIPQDRFRFGRQLGSIDGQKRVPSFDNSFQVLYKNMISSVPLDLFCDLINQEKQVTAPSLNTSTNGTCQASSPPLPLDPSAWPTDYPHFWWW
ncbi:hypothetical protein PtA15_10A74 [Puccinia triticina]|uniref:Uncharacterized protein n=1 Tax=Puccinia triticina TaxID=208348 RepID=A0ABY7CXZ1_9BASI|nr:uncharacterized protein PtA15_10A74 [Puccinia triticina]WAQ88655.1 hypothetical protein PtA15_10A74 [Puccinia triticina]